MALRDRVATNGYSGYGLDWGVAAVPRPGMAPVSRVAIVTGASCMATTRVCEIGSRSHPGIDAHAKSRSRRSLS